MHNLNEQVMFHFLLLSILRSKSSSKWKMSPSKLELLSRWRNRIGIKKWVKSDHKTKHTRKINLLGPYVVNFHRYGNLFFRAQRTNGSRESKEKCDWKKRLRLRAAELSTPESSGRGRRAPRRGLWSRRPRGVCRNAEAGHTAAVTSFSASNFSFFLRLRIFDENLSGFRDKFQRRVTCVCLFSINFAKTN